jgi:Tol biopolymer transport system component
VMYGERVDGRPSMLLVLTILSAGLFGCSGASTPTQPIDHFYPRRFESPDWSSSGLLYEDRGVVCVQSSIGVVVDTGLVGIWRFDPNTNRRIRLLTTGSSPGWSPAGDSITFSSSGAICVADTTTLTIKAVTSPGNNYSPRWSTSGWLCWRQSAPSNGVWIARTDGSEARRLVPFGQDPDWHPDGDHIVYTHYAADGTRSWLCMISISTLQVDTILTSVGFIAAPRCRRTDGTILYTLGTALPTLKVLGSSCTTSQTGIFDPCWSPDGIAIAYLLHNSRSPSPEQGTIWQWQVCGAVPTQLVGSWPQQCP